MPDKSHYEGFSHAELYNQLVAGNAEQVENLASGWASVRSTLNGLGDRLRDDLVALAGTWDSDSGDEYRRRLGAISTFSHNLAKDAESVQTGLQTMAAPLRKALREAESPDETDDNDKTVSGAATGALIAGLPGAVVGGFLGHNQDKEEQEKAHQRMVKLVSDLAADYELRDASDWPGRVTPPTAELPGTVDSGGNQPLSGPRVGAPSAAPVTGVGGGGGPHAETSASTSVSEFTPANGGAIPVGSATTDPTDPGVGSGLAGAESGSTGGGAALGAAWSVGAVGAVAGAGMAGGGVGGGAGGSAQMMPTNGVLGAGSGAGGGARGGLGSGAQGLKSAAMPGGQQGGQGARAGSSGTAQGDLARGRSDSRAAMGPGRTAGEQDEDADERMTWLREDDLVWGGNDAPPAILDGTIG